MLPPITILLIILFVSIHIFLFLLPHLRDRLLLWFFSRSVMFVCLIVVRTQIGLMHIDFDRGIEVWVMSMRVLLVESWRYFLFNVVLEVLVVVTVQN